MTINPKDDLGNVQVEFVWGNLPMQPDELRGENTLDPALDNHSTAVDGYQGYPGYSPNTGVAPTEGFNTTDATLTSVGVVKNTLIGWSMSKPDNGIAIGDWIRVSGATVSDGRDVNGDYLIDAKDGSEISSVALREVIGTYSAFMASGFGTATVLVDHQ